ncbi:hypothetical protein Taro_053948, partial [Colocasia esculenta]|nr:hypothetical protein [Colocasia esculenta]
VLSRPVLATRFRTAFTWAAHAGVSSFKCVEGVGRVSYRGRKTQRDLTYVVMAFHPWPSRAFALLNYRGESLWGLLANLRRSCPFGARSAYFQRGDELQSVEDAGLLSESRPSRSGRDGTIRRILNRKCSLNPAGRNRAQHALFGQGEELCGFSAAFRRGSLRFGVFSPRGVRVKRGKHREIVVLRILRGVWARSTPGFSVCDRDSRGCCILNVTLLHVAFLLPLCGADRLHVRYVLGAGRPADVSLEKAMPRSVAIRFSGAFRRGSLRFGMFSPRGVRVKWGKHREIVVLHVLHGGSTTPTVVTSLVGCPRFSVSQVVSSELVPLGEFPIEPVTGEAHPYSPQAKVERKFRYRLPVRGRIAAVLGQCLQQCNFFSQLYYFTSGQRRAVLANSTIEPSLYWQVLSRPVLVTHFHTAFTWAALHARCVAHAGASSFKCVEGVRCVSYRGGKTQRDLTYVVMAFHPWPSKAFALLSCRGESLWGLLANLRRSRPFGARLAYFEHGDELRSAEDAGLLSELHFLLR